MADDHSFGFGIGGCYTLVDCFGIVGGILLGFGIDDSLDSCC